METIMEKDWLILSKKWSLYGAPYMAWYRPDACGYTVDLEQAGRFTKEEAESRTAGGEGVTVMVRVEEAYALAERPVMVTTTSANCKALFRDARGR